MTTIVLCFLQYKSMMKGNLKCTMTKGQVTRLEAIGFLWSIPDSQHVPWEMRFEEMVAFKRQHGKCQQASNCCIVANAPCQTHVTISHFPVFTLSRSLVCLLPFLVYIIDFTADTRINNSPHKNFIHITVLFQLITRYALC